MKTTLNAKEICEAITHFAASKGVSRGEGPKEVKLVSGITEQGEVIVYAEIEELHA